MALCFLKCVSTCGCRECVIRKFAFYPPSPGYRFQLLDFSPLSSTLPPKSTHIHVVSQSSLHAHVKQFFNVQKHSPRLQSIQSIDREKYELFLVYNDFHGVLHSEVSQGNERGESVEDKKKKKKKKKCRKEERFEQVEDLNLICFKRLNRNNDVLCGYHIEHLKQSSDIVVIYSHGNSTDIGYIINQALDIAYNLRVNVIAYDYSGYGESSGQPGEKAFIYDLEAIYKLSRELGYEPINIILYGQSIGSGPSTFIASSRQFPVGGLIIHSGFTSGLRITQKLSTKMKTHRNDFFPNVEFIKKVNAPILIIHGTNDKDIHMHHANELYDKTKKNYQPFFFKVEGAGHNNIEHDDVFRKNYFKQLRKFFKTHRLKHASLHVDPNTFLPSTQDMPIQPLSGYPGDGWSSSFSHIYNQFFTHIDQLQEQKEESLQNARTQQDCSSHSHQLPPSILQQDVQSEIHPATVNDSKGIDELTGENNTGNHNNSLRSCRLLTDNHIAVSVSQSLKIPVSTLDENNDTHRIRIHNVTSAMRRLTEASFTEIVFDKNEHTNCTQPGSINNNLNLHSSGIEQKVEEELVLRQFVFSSSFKENSSKNFNSSGCTVGDPQKNKLEQPLTSSSVVFDSFCKVQTHNAMKGAADKLINSDKDQRNTELSHEKDNHNNYSHPNEDLLKSVHFSLDDSV